MLVIGCGNARHNHLANGDVTIDTNAAMNPTHVASILDPNSVLLTTAAYRRNFNVIYFEKVPADVFDTDAKCRIVVTHLAILLAPNGRVRIRSGAWASQHLPKLRKAFKSFGFVIEHDLIDTDNGFVPNTRLVQLGVDVGSEYQDEFGVDFVVKRGAGTATKAAESPI
jgi:hypothetical protein